MHINAAIYMTGDKRSCGNIWGASFVSFMQSDIHYPSDTGNKVHVLWCWFFGNISTINQISRIRQISIAQRMGVWWLVQRLIINF